MEKPVTLNRAAFRPRPLRVKAALQRRRSVESRFSAAAKLPVADQAGPKYTFKPSSWDSAIVPSGQVMTAEILIGYLLAAERGQTGQLFAFYDEMRATDPHLDCELQKATDALTGAKFSVKPWPEEEAGGDAAEAKLSQAVAKLVRKTLFNPSVRIRRGIAALDSAHWKSVGGFALKVEPEAGEPLDDFAGFAGRRAERIKSITEVPAQRYRYDGTTLLFQRSGDFTDALPLDEIGASLVTMLVDESIPSPARRGILRKCLNYWLIKRRGVVWWAEFIEKFGTPFRIGLYTGPDSEAAKILEALSDLGNAGYGAFPAGTEIKFLEAAARIGGETPHERIADWCDRQISKVVSGHDQSSGVMKDAGSKQSSGDGQKTGNRRSDSRGQDIADELRSQLVMPFLERCLGTEIAQRFCPLITIQIEREKDLVAISEAMKNFHDAENDAMISARTFSEITGFEAPGPDDKTVADFRLPPVAPAPAFGATVKAPAPKPGGKSALKPGKAGKASQAASLFPDPGDTLEALELKAERIARGAGDEIVSPYAEVIRAAAEEGLSPQDTLVRVLHRITEQVDAEELGDRLAVVLTHPLFTGIQTERAARKAA
ncbi:MAG: DUF935 family protein, partial [Thermoanaerobaculia bacterium]